MGLSNDLISQFVEITKQDKDNQNGATVYGTIKKLNGQDYVQIDGSELMTPIKSTTYVSDGERVTVMIKNHQAIVTGNITSPAARQTDVDTTVNQKIAEFDIIVTDQIEAQYGKFEQLVTDNITAVNGEIENLKAENLEVKGTLIAQNGEIENLKTKKLDAETANITFATIESLKATDIEVNNIKGNFAEFSQITTDNITAVNGEIENLKAEKLNVADADIKYANIDFANIGMAAVEELFVKSGIIKDIVVGDQHITGELVGVTIKGDLIEGNTIVAEKLVVKGSDGLYYKLNTDGMKVEAQQTEYNSLNGSIITAKSITASKVMVDDLVAFDATIGGFKITDNAIHSGVKSSVNNTTTGVYLDNTGQIAFGDSNNYIKFFKDVDNQWKLMISASSMKMSASNKTVEEAISDINEQVQGTVKLVENYYAISDSYTVPPTTGWSKNTPTWVNGKYIWSKTKTTYIDGSSTESNPACITGAKGESGTSGSAGKGIKNITNYYLATSTNSGIAVSTSGWTTTMQHMTSTNKYLWNYEMITYTDDSTTKTNPVIIGVYGDKGQNGAAGEDGVGILSITEKYAVSSSNSTAPTTWYDTVQTMTSTNRYLWNYEIVKYTNNTTSETAKRVIGVYGDKGDRGLQGLQGPKGDQGIPGNDGADGKTSYFHIKYSSVAKPTSASQMTETPNTYIGTYVDYNAADSTDPTKYTWSRFEGLQGPKGDQGIPGTNGTNGKTSYLHIKYSNDGGKTFTANNGEEPGDWIGQYTDFNVNDSTSVTAYTWSLIKGETGVGISSVDVEYYLSTSSTAQSGGSWSTTAPTWVDGKYMWSRTKTITTAGKTTYSNPVCITGGKGNTGATGATGATGKGVSSITEEYYLSTSKTTQSGGSWTTTPPTWSSGKYMWTRSKIVYTNPASTVYTAPVCDSSWEAVNEIQVGGVNLALRTSGGSDWTIGVGTDRTTYFQSSIPASSFTKNVSDEVGGTAAIKITPPAVDQWFALSQYLNTPMKKPGIYTFSMWIKADSNTTVRLGYRTQGGTAQYVTRSVTTSWTRISVIINVTATITYHHCWLVNDTTTPLYTSHWKVELGNTVTDWSPAPEDINQSIGSLETRVSTAEQKITSDAIVSTVTSSSKWSTLNSTATTANNTANSALNNANSANSKIDNLQIGGRNLALRTRGGNDWNIGTDGETDTYYQTNVPTSNFTKNITDEVGGTAALKIVPAAIGQFFALSRYTNRPALTKTGMFTFSIWVKADSETTIRLGYREGASVHSTATKSVTTKWSKISVTYTTTASITHHNCWVYFDSLTPIYTSHWKVEEGNKATDWTPAPEDTDSVIASLETRVSTAEQKITAEAILNSVNTQIGAGGQINTVSTILDKTGFTVKNGAIKVQNKNGENVMTSDTNGNLILSGGNMKIQNQRGGLTDIAQFFGGAIGPGLTLTSYVTNTGNQRSSVAIRLSPDDFDRMEIQAENVAITGNKGGSLSTNTVHASSTSTSQLWINNNQVFNGNDTWIRTYGDTGWYSQTYGGGWYMTDSTWIRSYGNKQVYINNLLRADGGLQVGDAGSKFSVSSAGSVTAAAESRFSNGGTYSDPWHGTACAIKASGHIAATGTIRANGTFKLGSTTYGALGYDSSTADVYVENAANNWLRLKKDMSMTYAGYQVYTAKNFGTIPIVGTRITNLNTRLASGWYSWSSGATGAPASYGVLLVIQWSANADFCQIAISTGNSMWTRWYVNGSYTGWVAK